MLVRLMKLPIDLEQEEDGRWLAAIPDLPGVLAYGSTPEQAASAARALALRVLADRVEHGEELPEAVADLFAVPT
jgi:predicted RNase H-like HicB family nuclease